jgi:hypothetical protein
MRLLAIALLAPALFAAAEDNALTPKEKEAGWQLLFDGKTFDGWMTSDKKESKTPIEEGCINPHGCGAYMMIHKDVWANFVLRLDFKISPKCNSGVFFWTWPLEPLPGKDVGWNGIEVAIDDTTTAGYVDTGAIYDLSKPTKNAMKPVGEWNRLKLRCQDGKITVTINGEKVNVVDLNQFTEKNKRPDGTEHKFDIAFKDHAFKGYIGLQDHGSPCWYKNIKIRAIGVDARQ